MKTRMVVSRVVMATIFLLTLAIPANADTSVDEIRISSIDDSYIGKVVTVSGIIVAISSNIEPSTTPNAGIQTYEPGDTSILTIYDGTDRIFVSSEPKLLEKFAVGEKIAVTGIYAGKGGITEGKGIIYADEVSSDIESGYKDVTIVELIGTPKYYYDDSVRIKGDVTGIELTSGETELEIDDHTGTMDVEYGAEIDDIKMGDEVVVEGKFYWNKIYAFAVKASKQAPEVESHPTPTPGPSPTPGSPVNETPAPSPTPIEAGGGFHLPLYLIVIIIAVVAVAGVFIAFKVRNWLMIRRYG
ncbi:hypothetical protein ES705_06329 [subsurface metagenome]|nr:hypothetical protein [Methanosarcinales archaeon]